MTLNKFLFVLTVLSAITTPAFAYNIYNKTAHSVQVKDNAGFGGIDVTMTPNGVASCNPEARGCSGKISFAVYATQKKGKVICTWYGNIKNDRGNYFVISSVPGINYLESGSCNVEYFHE